MRPRGRRRGDSGVRQRILETARSAFAELGYDRATLRRIASEAEVDAALVHHYFGNKEELFAAAVRLPLQPSEALAPILEGGVEQMGGRLARLFFTIWEAAESREALLAQLRHAMTEQGQAIPLAEFVSNAVLPRLVPHLTGPERKLRLELAASHLVGLAILRYVVRLEPVASAPVTKLIEEVAPRVQGYLSGGP